MIVFVPVGTAHGSCLPSQSEILGIDVNRVSRASSCLVSHEVIKMTD